MRIARIIALLIIVGAGNLLCAPSWALFDNYGLDASFCQQPTLRSTVVYIDDMMMADGQTEWATKLATKLRATLTPGERVSVVRLSPANGQSKEYWSGCWPDYPAARKAALANQTYILEQNPLDRIADQKKYFIRDLGAAVTRIYLDSKRPPQAVGISAASPPQKQILRALASDEGRFSDSATTIRAIVYSDLAENSDLGSVFQPAPAEPPAYGQRLGSYLRHGVFYDYGMGQDVHGDPAFPERARAFWNAALRSMAATVIGLGADLNVPNTLPTQAYSWPVTLTFDGQPLDGRLSLLVGEDGNLVDSSLGISRLGSAALSGTFKCADQATACRLEAETATGIATSAPSELLSLRGSVKALAGKLGVRGQNTTFALKTGESDD
ncbi:hypothetical protein [Rhodopila sp.]|uniref:hypothetical protein n=1 Tax=Rhodopila sp. TaxID=2480087 RepID=UPI003D095C77